MSDPAEPWKIHYPAYTTASSSDPHFYKPQRSRLQRFVIRWEMPFYLFAVIAALAGVAVLVFVFPDVSNLTVTVCVLVSGAFSTMAAAISAIKTRDPQ